MALIEILQYPDVRLKKIADPITSEKILSPVIQTMIDNMFETMYNAKGIGLAATQVDLHWRIITIDLGENSNQALCLINPQIIYKKNIVISQEGCLSFPGVFAKVNRFQAIEISFLDRQAIPHNLSATDLMSFCIQHEIDHLNGITFFDHLSPLKQAMLTRKMHKLKKYN